MTIDLGGLDTPAETGRHAVDPGTSFVLSETNEKTGAHGILSQASDTILARA